MYYYVGNKTGNWSNARYDCLSRGGDLAVPSGSDINAKIYQLVKGSNISKAWIGMYRNDNDEFITVDGVNVSYVNWYKGQPNDWKATQDCIVLMYKKRGKDVGGQWNDISCVDVSPYHVCEQRIVPNT